MSLLRSALMSNALFSTVSGTAMLLGGAWLTPWMGIPWGFVLPVVGVGLLGFAALVGWTATRPEVNRPLAVAISIGDLGWVLGSTALLALSPAWLTGEGWWAVAVVADFVGLFAVGQLIGAARVATATG